MVITGIYYTLGLIAAVHAVVHENLKPADAFELLKSLRAKG